MKPYIILPRRITWWTVAGMAAAIGTLMLPGPSASGSSAFLTPEGIGAVRIGMTPKQVLAIWKTRWKYGPPNSPTCSNVVPASMPGMTMLFENGRLGRISIQKGSFLATAAGIHIGSSDREVLRAYGANVQVANADYEPPPAKVFTVWKKPNALGIKFVTNSSHVVSEIRVGNHTIDFIEGCS